jgi:hypothetical protein
MLLVFTWFVGWFAPNKRTRVRLWHATVIPKLAFMFEKTLILQNDRKLTLILQNDRKESDNV